MNLSMDEWTDGHQFVNEAPRPHALQAQGDLEQEQLDAAEALVSAGEDLNQLEQRTDSQNRHLEAGDGGESWGWRFLG